MLLAAVSLVGCAGGDQAGEVDDLDADKADGVSYPLGTFDTTSPKLYEVSELTLNADKSFGRQTEVACAGGGGCGPEKESGTYKFTKSGSIRYIRFLDEKGALIDRYQWTLSGKTLKIRNTDSKAPGTEWITLMQVAARVVAQMNDVSILLPLATTQADFNAYLPASAEGVGGPLVPKDIFTAFDVPAMTAVGPGAPELVYSTLRLVAARLDPCFAQIGPITDPTSCQNQLRVIFQSLSFGSGTTTAEDSGLHVFYSLTRDQFTAALRQVIALREANGGEADLGPLAVHPIIAKQGVAGAMGKALAAIIEQYAGTGTITRMTRIYSSNDFWDFNGIDIANGAPLPMVIPTLPNNSTTVEFVSPLGGNTLGGTFVPGTTSSDNMDLLALFADAEKATTHARQSAFDAVLRIENPNFNSPNTIDCASCHVSAVARMLNGAALGLSATGDPNAFVAPASIPSADLAATAPPIPGADSRDFHMFSYKGTQPLIMQRVINETASVVAYVNAQVLTSE